MSLIFGGKVVAGDYKGRNLTLFMMKTVQIEVSAFKMLKLTKETVEAYEILNGDTQVSSFSAVSRASLGSLLVGPVGATAALGAAKKGRYLVAVQFKDGKRSLLEMDERFLRKLIISLF